MVSNLKSWFQKLQKSSILKSVALVILWGEEKKGQKKPRFLIFKDRVFQAKFVSFFSKNLTMSLFLVRELGRPNLQKVPETLLHGARLRAFSKLFLDLTLFFQSEVV